MEPVLLDMALKGAAVLALTGAVAAGARSASAAARHLVWSIGLAAVLALPLLQWLLPDWSPAILPARQPATVSGSVPAMAGAPDLARGLRWLWLAGTAATIGGFLVGWLRVRWIARAAPPWIMDPGRRSCSASRGRSGCRAGCGSSAVRKRRCP